MRTRNMVLGWLAVPSLASPVAAIRSVPPLFGAKR